MYLWNKTASIPEFPVLDKDKKTDVLVIGGGIAGILCARKLKDAGVDCILAEAHRILGGVTAGTTAKITAQHGLIYDKLIGEFGVEKARLYLDANLSALAEYRALAQKFDFDFEDKPSAVYSLDSRSVIEREVAALERLGFAAKFSEKLPIPLEGQRGAVIFPSQAQMDPYKLMSHLVKDLNIFENTRITELIPGGAKYESGEGKARGRITAEKIVVATHFPFISKHGGYFIKQFQRRSYVLALENCPNIDGMYVDADTNGLSFRNAGSYLLLGGGTHRTGTSGGGYDVLRGIAAKLYPEGVEKYAWATQDCITLDGVPYVGKYSSATKGLYVITGFNEWGMTSSLAAANVMRDLILGKSNRYSELLSPSRSIMRPQLAKNAWHYTKSLLSFGSPRCPHLGCALVWNKQEHTWDCPCHGSRFTADGKVVDNPSNADISAGKLREKS